MLYSMKSSLRARSKRRVNRWCLHDWNIWISWNEHGRLRRILKGNELAWTGVRRNDNCWDGVQNTAAHIVEFGFNGRMAAD